MKILVILLFNLSILAAHSDMFIISSSSLVPHYPGINPITGEPDVGSDWELRFSSYNQGNCSEFSQHKFYDGEDVKFFIDYLDEQTSDCSSASNIEDPNDDLSWSDEGIVQEVDFEIETITCDIELGDCNIDQNFTNENKNYFDLSPTKGGNGTASGQGVGLVYNLRNFSSQTQSGTKGSGGIQDINYSPSNTYLCLSKKDAQSEGVNSPFAKKPLVEITRYEFKAFELGVDASDGQDNQEEQKRVEIYKGLDASQRSLIYDLIIDRNENLDYLSSEDSE